MGMFGNVILLTIGGYLFMFLLMKIFGSTQNEKNTTEEAIQKDTDEFNHFS